MGFFSDVKKNKKKMDKLFGVNKKKAAPTKPKKKGPVIKKYKLSKFNPSIDDGCYDLDQDEKYYLSNGDGDAIGFFPASAENFLDNYDGQNMDFEIDDDGYCHITYEEIE